MDRSVLARKPLTELKTIASSLEMRGFQRLRKADLIEAIIKQAEASGSPVPQAADTATKPKPQAQKRSRPAKGGDGGQLALEGTEEPSANGSTTDGEQAAGDRSRTRSRVRTRTRERTEQQRQQDGQDADDATGDGQTGAPQEGDVRQSQPQTDNNRAKGNQEQPSDEPTDRDGSDGDQADQSDTDQEKGQQQRQPSGGGNQQDGANRNRRSRRDRRRGKGKKGGQNRFDDDPNASPGEVRMGILDVLPEGYGFLRVTGYLPGDRDVYVSQSHIRRHGLRRGDLIEGPIRQQRNPDKVPGLHHVQKVNNVAVDDDGNIPHRPDFKDMTPLFPDERLRLETPDGPTSMRIVDLMSPIGKGQRGLIVSPPKAGKTTVLKELGQAISYNNPEVHLMVVLVDERPEEVTDMQRSVPGEIIASTFDRPADDHTQVSELAIERAKRMVERGKDVVILLDSITRLSRAYNLAAPASGRIMSGGVDSSALYPPKRFFGAARNIEGGGSLTIIATALIETGSKMDEVIFEEFKGTGNMELRLDRRLEQKRVFPAIDIESSGTRKEELLLDREELTIIWKLRRVLAALEGPAALELLIDKMKSTQTNNQFLIQIQKSNLQN